MGEHMDIFVRCAECRAYLRESDPEHLCAWCQFYLVARGVEA